MGLDSTQFRANVSSDVKLPLVGDPLISKKTLDELKVPEEVQQAILKDPNAFNNFFANRFGDYSRIVYQPEIKALSGDIPEPGMDFSVPVVGAGYPRPGAETATLQDVTPEEQEAMQAWAGEQMDTVMKAQGTEQVDQLIKDVHNYIDQTLQEKPALKKDLELAAASSPTDNGEVSLPNIMDDMVNTELRFEKAEDEEKFHKVLMALAAKGDVQGFMLAMAGKGTYIFSQKVGKALQAWKNNLSYSDKLTAQYDLSMKSGKMSNAELAKFNADQGKVYASSSTIHQAMQTLLQKKDQYQNLAQSVMGSQESYGKTVTQNLRVG